MTDQDVLVDDIRVRGIGKSHFVEEIVENDKEMELNSRYKLVFCFFAN